ncbi:MAG: acyl carrier protein [Isosphaeraceae bacterium]
MDRHELRAALREMVEETTGEPCAAIEDGQNLREGLGLDSVDLFSLVIETQTRFRIKIATADLEGIERVGQYLDLVEEKLAALQSQAA